jgi:hypothetical protein
MPTVTGLRLFAVDLPFKVTVRHAAAARTTSESLFLRARLDDGTEGWGECLPGESLADPFLPDRPDLGDSAEGPGVVGAGALPPACAGGGRLEGVVGDLQARQPLLSSGVLACSLKPPPFSRW